MRSSAPRCLRRRTVSHYWALRSVSDVVREAIAVLVEQRRSDKSFLRLLDDNLARHRQALELLRDDRP